ncbi:hypothetical protein KUCAC02_031948 [Chaenocephalus aceratus]|nr:hypothetical protein KUCAC02_031948 [Chaenocephalus aceratus]
MDMGLMTGCYKVGERMSPKKSSPLYHIHVRSLGQKRTMIT